MPLCTAYLFYPTLPYIGDDSMWVFSMVIASSLSFDSFSKQWKLKPRKKRSLVRRFSYLGLAVALYLALIGSYLYFNAAITDSEGEEIKLSEAVRHFLTSPIWLDLKVRFNRLKDVLLETSKYYNVSLELFRLASQQRGPKR